MASPTPAKSARLIHGCAGGSERLLTTLKLTYVYEADPRDLLYRDPGEGAVCRELVAGQPKGQE